LLSSSSAAACLFMLRRKLIASKRVLSASKAARSCSYSSSPWPLSSFVSLQRALRILFQIIKLNKAILLEKCFKKAHQIQVAGRVWRQWIDWICWLAYLMIRGISSSNFLFKIEFETF
jgi:hypothetical protein